MTWTGARGTTADEMAKVLHLPDDPDVVAKLGQLTAKLKADAAAGGFQFRSANALWNATRFPFVSEYLAQMENTLGVHLGELDFAADPTAARQTINAWIADQTHDKIKDLLGPGNITPETRLLLANAVFFKAAWQHRQLEQLLDRRCGKGMVLFRRKRLQQANRRSANRTATDNKPKNGNGGSRNSASDSASD